MTRNAQNDGVGEGSGGDDAGLASGLASASDWHVMLEQTGHAYFRTDGEGRFQEASRGWERLTGRSVADLIGVRMGDLLRFDEGESCPVLEALQTGRAATSAACRVLSDDGLTRWIELSAVPQRASDGSIVGTRGLARDITFWKEETTRLRETAERYRVLSEITSDCTYSFRIGPSGDVAGEWASNAIERLTGFTVDDIRARGWESLLLPADLPIAHGQLQSILQGEQCTVEYRMVTRDGSHRWVRDTARPVLDASGRVTRIEGGLQDITQQRSMEAELAESLDRYRTLFENANAAILIADVDTGLLVDVNTDTERLFGRSRSELIGMHQSELHPPEELDRYREMFRQHTSAERYASFEAEIIRGDGRRVPVSIHGSSLTFGGRLLQIGVFQDLTERKVVEEALQRENAFRRIIIERAAQGMAVCRFVRGNKRLAFTVWNDRMTELTGYSIDEINRVGWFSALWPEEQERERARERMSFSREGQDARDETWDVVRKDGERRRLSISTTHLEGAGEERQVLALVSDLTERERMTEQLRQSEKMEAIGQLAGGIAHDFNNQLAGIMGLADLLRLRLHADEELASQAARIVSICDRSRGLTQQLLAFARRGQYQNTPIDMHDVVREVVSLLAHSIDKRISIRQELHAEASHCMGDPSQLQSAILNIALNARDAMPQGGELTFTSWNEPVAPSVEGLVLSVRDTGVGMTEDTRRRIFEPFFTTKPPGRGTGMGLAAAYGTVRLHHGRLDVESTAGVGSVFRVHLPSCATPGEHEALVNSDQTATKDQHVAHVLLVDDEYEVREAVRAMLEALGYQVTVCANGRDAADQYRERWREVDAIVLDMVMPQRSGRQTYLALREINPEARVLLISGHSVESKAQSVIEAGAAGFLQKPFSLHALSHAMSTLLDRAADSQRDT